MKTLLFLLSLVISFLPTNIALGENSEGSNFGSKKIHLGVIVPLTGPLAFFGNDFVRAYKLAVEDRPEIEKRISIHWEDSAYDSKQAISAFNKLISIDKAEIVLSFGGPMLNALAPLAEANKVPFFATESEKSDCQGRKYCSLFRNEEDEWGQATWKALRKRGQRNIGIVKNQNQFMNTFVNAIIRNKNETEKVEILLDVPPDMVDLRSSVASMKTKDIDAIGVYFLPGSHHGFLNALQALNKTFHMFGVEEFMARENNRGFENVIDGVLVIAPGSIDSYRAKFEAKYGYSAGFFYTPAFYDFLVLLEETIASNANLRGIDLVNALHFSGERTGVSGKYSAKVSKAGVHSYSFPIFIYKVTGTTTTVDEVINF